MSLVQHRSAASRMSTELMCLMLPAARQLSPDDLTMLLNAALQRRDLSLVGIAVSWLCGMPAAEQVEVSVVFDLLETAVL